jgi:hypothetical protein
VSGELPEELAAKRDELLRNATARGMRMRIRRRVAVAATVVVAVSVVVGTAAAFVGGDHRARVVTAPGDATTETSSTTDASSPTTNGTTTNGTTTNGTTSMGTTPMGTTPTTGTDSSTPVSSVPPTDVPPPGGSSDTTAPPVTIGPGSSDTAPLVCHDSYDPRCGPLTFTSTPVNAPLELSVTQTATGLTVKLHIHASDDAAVDPCMRIQWGDGGYSNGPSRFGCTAMGTCPMFRQRYGPWDPPPPTPEAFTIDFTHTYGKAGTFAVTVDADSADPCSPDQFHASEATRKLDVTVTTPTSSTAP